MAMPMAKKAFGCVAKKTFGYLTPTLYQRCTYFSRSEIEEQLLLEEKWLPDPNASEAENLKKLKMFVRMDDLLLEMEGKGTGFIDDDDWRDIRIDYDYGYGRDHSYCRECLRDCSCGPRETDSQRVKKEED